jgi:glutaredoxin-like protein
VIPLRDQEAIRERFAQELEGPVKIDLFTQRPTPVMVPGREECAFCPQVQQLLEEVSHLSDKIALRVIELGSDRTLEERYGVERAPAFVIRGVVNRPLLFTGFPAVNLFPLLIEAIIMASMSSLAPPPALKRRLKRLRRAVRVQVFVVPDAPYCAEQAATAMALGLASQFIRAEVIELSEYPALAERLAIRAVPTTVIDDKVILPGMVQGEDLVDEIVRATEQKTVTARSGLITGAAAQTTTILSTPSTRQEAPGTTRPSGLFIPGRGM